MATVKIPKENPICEKCKTPVKILIPLKTIGNAHGEEWICEKCGLNCEKILIKL